MGDVARAPGPLDSAHRLSAPVITRQSVQKVAHPAIVERGHAETDRVDASADGPSAPRLGEDCPGSVVLGCASIAGTRREGGRRPVPGCTPTLPPGARTCPRDPSPGTISPRNTEPDPVKPATGIRDALSRCAPT